MATVPTSIRLTPAEKRRIAAAARRRGLSPAAYIKARALADEKTSDERLTRLEHLAARLLETVEDTLDYRLAVSQWDAHVKSGSRLLKSREVWLELGV